MDGLKFSNGSFNTRSLGQDIGLRQSSSSQSQTAVQKSGGTQEASFSQTLQNAINSVNTAQKEADIKAQQIATGQSTNIHETMIASEKADIALRLMVQVRNKIIEAYQEIMRMQV